VDVQTCDLAQFSSKVLQGADFQRTSWVSPFDNPDPAVSRLLHSGGSANYGKYSDPQWIDDAMTNADPAKVTQDYQQVERQVATDLPVAFFSPLIPMLPPGRRRS
jgi:peptide/nickel transport system substrate-binding protein